MFVSWTLVFVKLFWIKIIGKYLKNKNKKYIYFIAEAGINHNGNINIAKKMKI